MKLDNLKNAFPDFDVNTLPAIPETWVDGSWHHDVCPAFFIGEGDSAVQVFIDFVNAAEREMPDTTRFCVLMPDGTTFGSDDWSEVLSFINTQTGN